MGRTSLIALALFAGGCCDQTAPCGQNAVEIVVSADAQSLDVSVEGWDDFTCEAGDGVTACRPDAIVDGDYDLVVLAAGYAPQPISLHVATNRAPPYSCECEIPRGSAVVDLAPSSPDAGAVLPPPDAGASPPPPADAGLPDAGPAPDAA